MKRLVVALAVWLACAGPASAQHEDERYVPETDPLGAREARPLAGHQVRPADALGAVQPVGHRRVVVDLRRGRGLVQAEPGRLHRVQAALRRPEDDLQPGEVRSGAGGRSAARDAGHEVRRLHDEAPRRLLDVRHEVHRLQGHVAATARSTPTRRPTSPRRSSTRSARRGSSSAPTSPSPTGTARTTGGRTSPRPTATSTTTRRAIPSAGRRSWSSRTTRCWS